MYFGNYIMLIKKIGLVLMLPFVNYNWTDFCVMYCDKSNLLGFSWQQFNEEKLFISRQIYPSNIHLKSIYQDEIDILKPIATLYSDNLRLYKNLKS
jgi:hypothetical protein